MGAPVLEVRVDGKPLRQFGAWGDLTYSFSSPGGSKECSWQMTSRFGSRLRVLRRNRRVEVFWGGVRLWAGYLSEPDWNGNEVSLTANGLFRRGELWKSLDGYGQPTANPAAAIFNAPGMGWVAGPSVPNAELPGDAAPKINTVTNVLDAWGEQNNTRWQVDTAGVVSMGADPTAASYLIRPGAGDLGIADDNYASHVAIYHVNTVGGYRLTSYPTPLRGGSVSAYEAEYGHSETVLDITDRGPMADADADQLALSVYQQRKRPGFTNSLTLARGEILNLGWRPIHPAAVRPNRVAWKLGTPDEVALTPHTAFVIGQTQYRDGDDTVTVTPVDKVSRTDEEVLTELLEAMEGTLV